MMELNEFLDEQEKVPFQIKTDEEANWALRKIKQKQTQKNDRTELAEKEIEKIKQWLESVSKELDSDIEYFEGLLGAYALRNREQDPSYKSQKLPNGRIRFKKQQPKWELDDKRVLESLKQAGKDDLIKVTEKPKLADIKKSHAVVDGKVINTETGEFLDGTTVREREDKFEVVID